MYCENWPVAQATLIFGANVYKDHTWFKTWKSLDLQPKVAEVIRNLPVKYPLIWIN